jgi:MFS family permease
MNQPTRARNKVLWFAVLLVIITYIDRVCIANFVPYISADLNLSKQEMGLALGAFALSYALFEIPTGWLGDRFGPRSAVLRIVIWWSFFTAATGVAWNKWSLVITRFLFGAGEAGAFPNLTKIFTIWMPQNERVRAQGIMWMAARWGGAFTGTLVMLMLHVFTWRQAFFVFGLIGVVWAVWFYRWYRDHPKDHPSVNEGELKIIGDTSQMVGSHHIPWAKFARSGSVWLLWLSYFCVSYGWYFYITWLPTYLREARNMPLNASFVLSGLPLFLGGIGCLVSGLLTPFLSRRWNSESKSRRVMSIAGVLGASAMLVYSTRIEDAFVAIFVIGLASFFNDLAMPPAWGACMDIGGKLAGMLAGSMNMMGNLAGFLAPIIIGHLVELSGANWNLTFYISAAIYLVSAVCWLFIDPVTPITADPVTAEAPVELPGGLNPRPLPGR